MATPAFTPTGSGYSTPTGTTGGMNTPLLAGRVLASRRVVVERHFGGRRYRGLHWCAAVWAGCLGQSRMVTCRIHKGRACWLCLLCSGQHFSAAGDCLLACTPVDLLACTPVVPISCCPKPHLHLYCVLLGAAGTTCQTCSTRSSTAPGEQRALPNMCLFTLCACVLALAAVNSCCCRQLKLRRYRFYLIFVVAYVTMVRAEQCLENSRSSSGRSERCYSSWGAREAAVHQQAVHGNSLGTQGRNVCWCLRLPVRPACLTSTVVLARPVHCSRFAALYAPQPGCIALLPTVKPCASSAALPHCCSIPA